MRPTRSTVKVDFEQPQPPFLFCLPKLYLNSGTIEKDKIQLQTGDRHTLRVWWRDYYFE